MAQASPPTFIAELRQLLERRSGGTHARARIPFGISAMDTTLPGGGLELRAIHANGRFVRERHAGLQHDLVALHQLGPFVHVEADAVTGAAGRVSHSRG
jgi:hypothetical protein